jgi:mannose-6-phosphate isomerase-like protein (cupin superfamily)
VNFPRGIWEGLGGETFIGGVEPFMITLEPGANSGRFGMAHTGHEFVLCLSGQLEYEVEDQRFTLNSGDSLLFAANLHHRWRNAEKTTCRAIVVLSGFEKGERPSEYHLHLDENEESLGDEIADEDG